LHIPAEIVAGKAAAEPAAV